MKKRFPKSPMWIVNAILIGALVMLISSMVGGQTVHATKVATLGGPGAKTLCDSEGNIEILVSREVPDDNLPEVLTHEAVHVLQIRTFPKCRDAIARYIKDKDFALLAETEAYCVETQVFSKNHNQVLASIDRITAWQWGANHGKYTTYEALKAFVQGVCGRPSPNEPVVRFISAHDSVATFEISHKETTHVPP